MPIKNEFKDEKLLKFIYELKKEGMSDSKIAEEVNKNFGIKIFRTTVREVYKKYMNEYDMIADQLPGKTAKSIIDWNSRAEEKFEEIDRITKKVMKVLEGLLDQSWEEGETLKYVKLIPITLNVCREILSQLQYLKNQQDQMRLEQKKATLSPLQIVKKIEEISKKNKKEERELEIVK
ncbi:MAG: hypothetical protein ABIH82_02500 [Candidatus Woesearchaeota archaeon]